VDGAVDALKRLEDDVAMERINSVASVSERAGDRFEWAVIEICPTKANGIR